MTISFEKFSKSLLKIFFTTIKQTTKSIISLLAPEKIEKLNEINEARVIVKAGYDGMGGLKAGR